MAILTQTTAHEINEQIGDLLDLGVLFSEDAPEILALIPEIEKLARSDSDESLALMAMVRHLVGDMDGALRYLDARQGGDPIYRLVLLSNYCHCTAALEVFSKECSPHSGRFTNSYRMGYAIGGFHKVAEFSRAAEKMRLSNLDKIDLEEVYMIDRLLSEFKISDHDTAELLETAGSVFTDNGLLFLGKGPDVEVFDIPGEVRTVHLTYRLRTTAERAVDLYLQFIERLVEKDKRMPRGMHVSFEGVVENAS